MPQTPYIGDIYAFAFSFAPKGWATCNGQSLPIAQNQALFSILGTTYGGNGVTTFNLPNLQGRVPIHAGTYPGNVVYSLGQTAGEASHTLLIAEMPQHNHFLRGDATTPSTSNSGTPAANGAFGQSIGHPAQGSDFPINIYSTTASNLAALAQEAVQNQGGNQPHENRQPFQVLNYCIALQGVFPSRN